MRRPRSALFATSLAVGLGLSAPIAMAQQRGGNRPAPAADSSSNPTTTDPMIASRSARTLLRNGLDYLGYQEYEKALTYLRAAEARPRELTSDELSRLAQGIDQARRGLREPNRGRAPVTARSSRKVGTPLRDPEPVELTSGTRVLPPRQAEAPSNDPPEAVRATASAATPAPAPAGRKRGQVPNMPPRPFSNPAPAPRPVETAAAAPEPSATEPGVPPLEPPPAAVAETQGEPTPAPMPVASTSPTQAPAPAPASPATVDPELVPAQAPAAIASPPATPLPTTVDEPIGPSEPPPPLASTSSRPESAPTPPAVESPSPAPEPAPEPAPTPASEPADEAPAVAPAPTPSRTATARSNRMPSRTPPADFRYPPLPTGTDTPSPAPATAANRPTQGRSVTPGPAPSADEVELPPLPPSALTGNGRPRLEPELPPLPQDRPKGALPHHDDLPPDVRAQIALIEKRQEEELRQYGPGGRPRDEIGLSGESTSRLVMPRAPSPTEYRPIKAIPTPDDIPVLSPREWTPTRKYWAAAATCHGPLYFQDAALERYGQSVEQALGPIGKYFSYPIDDPRQSNQRRQILQPFASIGLFAFQIAAWPINAVLDPPSEPEYDLGYYRPGDRIPPDTIYLPFTGVGPALRGSHYP